MRVTEHFIFPILTLLTLWGKPWLYPSSSHPPPTPSFLSIWRKLHWEVKWFFQDFPVMRGCGRMPAHKWQPTLCLWLRRLRVQCSRIRRTEGVTTASSEDPDGAVFPPSPLPSFPTLAPCGSTPRLGANRAQIKTLFIRKRGRKDIWRAFRLQWLYKLKSPWKGLYDAF